MLRLLSATVTHLAGIVDSKSTILNARRTLDRSRLSCYFQDAVHTHINDEVASSRIVNIRGSRPAELDKRANSADGIQTVMRSRSVAGCLHLRPNAKLWKP